MEIYTSGDRAKKVFKDLGFNNIVRIDPSSFSNRIWVLWNDGNTKISILKLYY